MPKILGQLTREKRGLIVVTGATGSGKSTTLAAMMERINRERSSHIITIEDPIEFLIEDQKSTVEQREVGIDTDSFAIALRAALRQNPDVIMVGELRDAETVQTALRAAETGHLVLTTLHTADAPESMQRLLSFFEPHAQQNIRMTLAQVLRAIISQRLIMRVDSGGMVAAVEVLIGTSLVRDIIARGESTDKLVDAIKQNGANWGMQSFDDSLIALAQARMISTEDALNNATSRGDMELRLQGVGS